MDEQGLLLTDMGQIWIPKAEAELKLRICVTGHFGVYGHRGVDATLQAICEAFHWEEMQQDIKHFVGRCLHCAATSGTLPQPRPLGQQVHADRPNEVLHWDFVRLSEAYNGQLYALVVKDDASKYVKLYPTAEATAEVVAECLMDWFATFGISYFWVSDQGTHFKNEVIKEIQHVLGACHHFTTARCPWANGMVEVVMRDLKRCLRALLSEWRLQPNEWPRIIKLVQMALNNAASSSLGGRTPIEMMIGAKPISLKQRLSLPTKCRGETTLAKICETKEAYFKELQASMEQMHKETKRINDAKRAQGRKNHEKRGMRMAQFQIGDFVLYAEVWHHVRNTLKVTWCGPAEVTGTVSNWVFKIKNLITGEEREAHASRLKFFRGSALKVTEELLAHIAHNGEGHVAETLQEARYNAAQKRHEILVKWRGLDKSEASWEPAATIYEDIPSAVRKFIADKAQDVLIKKMATALGIKSLEGGSVAVATAGQWLVLRVSKQSM